MAHPTKNTTVTELRHLTTPLQALQIATSGIFHAGGGRGHYDGGMNLLGKLGARGNTFPNGRPTASLLCTWVGQVSLPLRHDVYHHDTPNVLFDFDGSARTFGNQDPRYFLPIGSHGITVNAVEIPERELMDAWCYLMGGWRGWLRDQGLASGFLMRGAQARLDTLNARCANGWVKLQVLGPAR